MATITLEVPDQLAQRLEEMGDGLPSLLTYALDLAGIPGSSLTPEVSSPWNEVLDFLSGSPEPQEILDFKVSDHTQERLEELLDVNREKILTPQQRDELEAFLQIDHLLTLLKARLRAEI